MLEVIHKLDARSLFRNKTSRRFRIIVHVSWEYGHRFDVYRERREKKEERERDKKKTFPLFPRVKNILPLSLKGMKWQILWGRNIARIRRYH